VSNGFRRLGVVMSLTLAVTSLAASSAGAQEFSADVVTTPANGTNTSRVYVGRTKMRIQTLQNGQPEASVIWDASQKSTVIVMDQNRSYIGGSTCAASATSGSGPVASATWAMCSESVVSARVSSETLLMAASIRGSERVAWAIASICANSRGSARSVPTTSAGMAMRGPSPGKGGTLAARTAPARR